MLAATSNPEGASVQRALSGARTVAQSVVDDAAAVNRAAPPQPGSVGVVIGATLDQVPDVSDLGGPVLVPGVGAQGGRPEALGGLGGADPVSRFPRCPAKYCAPDRFRRGPARRGKLRDEVAYLA